MEIVDEQLKKEKEAGDKRVQLAGDEARRWIDAQLKALSKSYGRQSALDEAKRKFHELRAANPNSELASNATYEAMIAGLSSATRIRRPPPKAFQDDAATKFIEQIRQQDAAVQAALVSTSS